MFVYEIPKWKRQKLALLKQDIRYYKSSYYTNFKIFIFFTPDSNRSVMCDKTNDLTLCLQPPVKFL